MRPSALLLAIALPLSAQEPAADFRTDPGLARGAVTDAAGEPVVGARVEVLCLPSAPYRRAMASLWEKERLPPALSAPDGTWVLPLRDSQRWALGAGPGTYFLRALHPDHDPWLQSLPGGLLGFLGEDLRLAPPGGGLGLGPDRPDDAPVDAVWAWWLGDRAHRLRGEWADSRSRVMPDWFALPSRWEAGAEPLPVQRGLHLLWPGSSRRFDLRTRRWLDAPPAREVPVAGLGDAPLRGRALYREPGGGMRWYPLPEAEPSTLREDAFLSARALLVEGFALGLRSEAGFVLAPRGAGPVRALRVRGGAAGEPGQALAGAWVRARPLEEAWEVPAVDGPARRPRSWELDADGSGRIPLPAADWVGRGITLEVFAPGHRMRVLHWPLAAGAEDVFLERHEGGAAAVRVEDPRGRPVPGAVLFLEDEVYDLGAARGVLRSDRDGVFTVGRLPAGRFLLRCVAPGFVPLQRPWQRLADDSELVLQLRPAREARIRFGSRVAGQLLDGGDPRPFASDARGRLWLRGLPESKGGPGESLELRSPSFVGGAAEFDPGDVGARLVSIAARSGPRIFVRAPAGSRYRQVSSQAGARYRSMPGDGDPAEGFFLHALPRGPEEADDRSGRLRIAVDEGPPLRVREAEWLALAGAHRPVLERSAVVREEVLPGLEELVEPEALRIEVVPLRGNLPLLGPIGGNFAALRAGRAVLCARDRADAALLLSHPRFAPLRFTLPGAGAEGVDLTGLEPGLCVEFHFVDAAPAAAATLHWTLTLEGRRIYQARGRVADDLAPGEDAVLRCPVGFAPAAGSYEVQLRIGRDSYRRSFRVVPEDLASGRPFRLEIRAR